MGIILIFIKSVYLPKSEIVAQMLHKLEKDASKASFSSIKMVAWDRIELPTRGFSVI
jgi:hypothetical protein